MKRFICIVSVFIVCLAVLGTALAEEFSLHSGVTFGMTIDDIKALEESKGFETSQNELWPNEITISGTIAGIERGALINYTVDEQGSLFKAFYFLGNNAAPAAQRISEYETINDALTQKYGASVYNTGNMQIANVPETLFGEKTTGFGFCQGVAGGEIHTYNQWLLDQDDGSKILIDHFMRDENGTLYQYIHYVRFDQEIWEAWENNRQTITDDL